MIAAGVVGEISVPEDGAPEGEYCAGVCHAMVARVQTEVANFPLHERADLGARLVCRVGGHQGACGGENGPLVPRHYRAGLEGTQNPPSAAQSVPESAAYSPDRGNHPEGPRDRAAPGG